MLIDSQGEAITQREAPTLRLVTPVLHASGLTFTAPGMGQLTVEQAPDGAPVQATMWKHPIAVVAAPTSASDWFSAYLHRQCTLVYQPDSSHRFRGPPVNGTRLNLSDGNPVHLISEASLADLNTRLTAPVDARRFRPNIVVRGTAAYAEDYWRRIRIGGIEFKVVESCGRCSIINVDEQGRGTGTVLKALASYRRWGNAVPFGQHLEYQQHGRLGVGDRIEVLETGDTPNPTG